MSLDISLNCDQITEISCSGTRYNSPLYVELSGANLVDAVDIPTIIREYGARDLLDGMDTDDIIQFLRDNGHEVDPEE